MKWFYKLQNKYRILIAIGAWVLTVIFASATSGLMEDERYSTIISITGCILLAVSIVFTVFTVKANKRERGTEDKQSDSTVTDQPKTSGNYSVNPVTTVNAVTKPATINYFKNEPVATERYGNALNTTDTPSHRDFGKWVGVNDSKEQLARFKRACLAENTPVEVVAEEARGVFSGAHGVYNTTLESCTCVDFQRRNLPCKHMYRLAIELGLIEGDVQTDKSRIISPDQPGMSLDDAVDIAETLSPYGQTVLREILLDLTYRNKNVHTKEKGCDYSEVLDSGIVEETSDGIVTVDGLKKERRNLCIYLGRRNEDDYYYDPATEQYISLPKGAKYSATISVSTDGSSVESGIAFPDDEVTAQLEKRGLNRCHAYNEARRNVKENVNSRRD